MSQLIIKTGATFGYLVIVGIGLLMIVAAYWCLIQSCTAKHVNQRNLVSSLLVLGFILLVVWSTTQENRVNPNPYIQSNEALLGQWENENAHLLLKSNGEYSCQGIRCKFLGASGKWQRFQDFDIDLIPEIGSRLRWRIIENNGVYQFVSGAEDDPDMWQTKVEFSHKPSL